MVEIIWFLAYMPYHTVATVTKSQRI